MAEVEDYLPANYGKEKVSLFKRLMALRGGSSNPLGGKIIWKPAISILPPMNPETMVHRSIRRNHSFLRRNKNLNQHIR